MFLNPIRVLGVAIVLLSITTQAQAEVCTPLNVIGATGTTVTKTVSPISTLVTNNNWNTDFSVPSNLSSKRYVAKVVPNNDANYDVRLSLKYSDASNVAYRKENVTVKSGQPLTLIGVSTTQSKPFQVNVFVGGINAIGNTYTVSVVSCV